MEEPDRSADRLVWRSRALEQLIEIGIAVTSEQNLSSLMDRIVLEARRFTSAEGGTLFLREDSDLRVMVAQNDVLARTVGEREMRSRLSAETLPIDVPSLAGYVCRTGAVLNIPDAYAIDPAEPYRFWSSWDARTEYRTRSVLVVPLRDRSGETVGVLELVNALDEAGSIVPFDPDYEQLVRALAAQAAVAIRNAQLTELSFRDALTGSYNRRYFALRLEEEIRRYERFEHPLALVYVDIDAFKEINDRAGHTAGDVVLTEVSQLLQRHSRSFTIVSRLGGDEFGALLVNTPKSGALAYAERIRAVIEAHPFPHGLVTISAGVAALPDDQVGPSASSQELMQSADAALYDAKRNGRNRVGRL